MGGGLDVWPTRLGRCLQEGWGSSGNERASKSARVMSRGAGVGGRPGASREEGAAERTLGVCFFLLALLFGAGAVGLATGILCGMTQSHRPWVHGGSSVLADLCQGCQEFGDWHSTSFFRGADILQSGGRGRCGYGTFTPTLGIKYLCSWLVDSWGIARLWRAGVCYTRWRRKKSLGVVLVQFDTATLGCVARAVSRARGLGGSQGFGLIYVCFGPAWAHGWARASARFLPSVSDNILGTFSLVWVLHVLGLGLVPQHRCGALARRPALASRGALYVGGPCPPVCNAGRIPLGMGALLPRRYG